MRRIARRFGVARTLGPLVLAGCFALLLVASGGGITGWTAPAPARTPWGDPADRAGALVFSHKLHIVDVGAECEDCHVDVESSRTSPDRLLPTHEQCEECHDVEEEEDECSMCHGDSDPGEFPMPERLILFDHALHVVDEAFECATCHADIEESEETGAIVLPAMETCSDCHDDAAAPSECALCHVDTSNLRPLSHRAFDWAQDHAWEMRLGPGPEDCVTCHTDDDCAVCHDSPTLAAGGSGAPRTLAELRIDPDGSRGLALEQVHELNYLFTHPLDVRIHARDCDTCHDRQDFCVTCHEGTQDGGFFRPVPLVHGGPDFVRVGVGSGGGRHAELARRDIESCAACHDEVGADPVCITCHEDRTPGLGNDPRTHASGFADFEGDWCSDPGSVCFQCHTDRGLGGLGFCGYCHEGGVN